MIPITTVEWNLLTNEVPAHNPLKCRIEYNTPTSYQVWLEDTPSNKWAKEILFEFRKVKPATPKKQLHPKTLFEAAQIIEKTIKLYCRGSEPHQVAEDTGKQEAANLLMDIYLEISKSESYKDYEII